MRYRFAIWGVEGENILSKFIDFRNRVKTLEDIGIRENLEGLEIFLFVDNTVS